MRDGTFINRGEQSIWVYVCIFMLPTGNIMKYQWQINTCGGKMVK